MTDKARESVEGALEALKRGELIVVADDERRENEGDLIVAAEHATPQAIQFMATEGRGLVCMAMTRARLRKLGLARMPCDGDGDPFRTAFMESVDAREGITTGISAHDRARTVQVLIDEDATAADLSRPGHLFPLEAAEHGVLQRPGHTEAAVDLVRLAGLKPAGVICEVMREDGQMMRYDDLQAFARGHGLCITTVADLIQVRKCSEKLVELEQEVRLPTDCGEFRLRMYHSLLEDRHHLALVMGDPASQPSALVRMHSECLTGDVFGSRRCDCGQQLHRAMRLVAEEGHGVVLYLRQEGRGIGLAPKIHAYALQDEGMDTVEANEHLGYDADLRDYCSAGQILRDLGLHHVRLLTNNPAKIEGLQPYGIEAERVSHVMPPSVDNQYYLDTKKNKLRHLL